MALSCSVSEMKRDGRKLQFFIPKLYSTPPLESPCRNIAITFGRKTQRRAYEMVKKFKDMSTCIDTTHERDRHPDRPDGQRMTA